MVLIGEIIASLIMIGVYLVIGKFNFTVVTGAALGSAVAVINIAVLCISINTAIDKFLAERGCAPMTEEEATAYANERTSKMALAAGGSFVVRILLMGAAIAVAFIVRGDWFDLIATIIPLAIYQPIIRIDSMIMSKRGKTPFMQGMPEIVKAEQDSCDADASGDSATESDTACESEKIDVEDGACPDTEPVGNSDGKDGEV